MHPLRWSDEPQPSGGAGMRQALEKEQVVIKAEKWGDPVHGDVDTPDSGTQSQYTSQKDVVYLTFCLLMSFIVTSCMLSAPVTSSLHFMFQFQATSQHR